MYPALCVLIELVAATALIADHLPEVLVRDRDFVRVSVQVVVQPNIIDEGQCHTVMVPEGAAELLTTADDAAPQQHVVIDDSLQQLLMAL